MTSNLTTGDRVTRADDGTRSPAVSIGSQGTVRRLTERGWFVVEWDEAPGGTYVYSDSDSRLFGVTK